MRTVSQRAIEFGEGEDGFGGRGVGDQAAVGGLVARTRHLIPAARFAPSRPIRP
jgi:hypothetical protein